MKNVVDPSTTDPDTTIVSNLYTPHHNRVKREVHMEIDNRNSGREYSLDEFLDALKNRNGEATTPEITSEVGCSDETTRRRMKELEEAGIVTSRKIVNAPLWQLDCD